MVPCTSAASYQPPTVGSSTLAPEHQPRIPPRILYPSMSFLRSEVDIDTSVKKAISPEETAPKRKHVRACVVYSWDHRDGKAFWHAVRMLPLSGDPVMTFKALIVIHKVLHEGHKYILKEAQNHVDWIRSLASSATGGGYRRLIDEYVKLLLHKLEFHRHHPVFNGTFEYEEYISLRSVDDPNEGYEAVIDLMNLQDSIDDYQRLLFASLGHAGSGRSGGGHSGVECRVSSLTAMVTESYGIYRFVTSMLRGLHQQSDPEVLEPLRNRYASQHRRLRRFYFECQGIKYLTSLITIPELDAESPDLMLNDAQAPALPKRPRELQPMATGLTAMMTGTPAPSAPLTAEPTGNWWQSQLAQQQQEQEESLRQMEAQQQQLEAERLQQEQIVRQQQQQFETEQAQLLAQQQQQQQEYLRIQQEQAQAQVHAQHQYQQNQQQAAQEQQLSLLLSQQQEAHSMLQQYDQRVQSLESDLSQMGSLTQQQLDAKQAQISEMQEQTDTWRQKYEALARLYSQLRHEHLENMARYRKLQTKAASAQEAVEKREKAERDLKSKNLELADLIRERDRARYELDKQRGMHQAEIEKLERHVALLNDNVNQKDSKRSADMNELVVGHTRQLNRLEEQLAEAEQRHARELANAAGGGEEAEILKEQIAQMEEMMGSLNTSSSKIDSILDAVLMAAYDQTQQALTSYDSPLDSGNSNATTSFVLNVCDSTISGVEAFCDSFTQYIAESDGQATTQDGAVQIIISINSLTNSVVELLSSVKGLSALIPTSQTSPSQIEEMLNVARDGATSLCTFYGSLNSEFLNELGNEEDQLELIITNHVEIQQSLQLLSDIVEQTLPKKTLNSSANLNDQVSSAMAALMESVRQANERALQLFDKKYGKFDLKVNEAIIGAATAITSAIGTLIQASSECQKEIVASGKQGESPENYYKKNHRWTDGLISAARTVGSATEFLIETADGTLSGEGTPEELIVSSREVASSIAQLVAASRVKAGHLSSTQQDLESASKTVTTACRSLVSQVEEILSSNKPASQKIIDYTQLSPMEFRSASVEQQVEVLKLEQELTMARNRLFEIRKLEYVNDQEE